MLKGQVMCMVETAGNHLPPAVGWALLAGTAWNGRGRGSLGAGPVSQVTAAQKRPELGPSPAAWLLGPRPETVASESRSVVGAEERQRPAALDRATLVGTGGRTEWGLGEAGPSDRLGAWPVDPEAGEA